MATAATETNTTTALELPPGVWRTVLQHLSLRERFVACMVCSAWRSQALSLLTAAHLEVTLNSGAEAEGFARWLYAHSHNLRGLTLSEFFFSTHSYHPPAAAAGGGGGPGVVRSRLGPIARVRLWQGLHAGGRPLEHLQVLQVCLDDIGVADAVAIGLCVMPALTHLTLESNVSAIGVAGAAGLAPLTTLRELVLPTQALGDQGLQYICSSLHQLRALNLHNDGHVTDDGLASLSGLTALSSLDLQGNVSITQAAMPVLAAAAPHLTRLNLSWTAMVNDWGLAQLSSLRGMQDLNLTATGVQLTSAAALSALGSMTALTRLNLSRCHITFKHGNSSALCTVLGALQDLRLAENQGLRSSLVGLLLPLTPLTMLTRLDLSSPRAYELREPDSGLSTVGCLTQLRHLTLCDVILRMDAWLVPISSRPPRAAEAPAVLPQHDWPTWTSAVNHVHQELLAAGAAAAAALEERGDSPAVGAARCQPAAAAPDSAAAAAAVGSSRSGSAAPSSPVCLPYIQLMRSIATLPQLAVLEFGGNHANWPNRGDMRQQVPFATALDCMWSDVYTWQPALLLLHLVAAQQTALQTMSFNAPQRASAGLKKKHAAAGIDAMLAAAAAAAAAAEGAAPGVRLLELEEEMKHWLLPLLRDTAAAMLTAIFSSKGGSLQGSAPAAQRDTAQQQRLQVLAQKAHAHWQWPSQAASEDATDGDLLLPEESGAFTTADAAEALGLLLPSLRYLDY